MAEREPFGTSGFTTTRVFAATGERVWREWTEPESFADWFGGAECEVPLSTVSMEVRAGGAWRATMFCGPERRMIRGHQRADEYDRAQQGWGTFFARIDERLAAAP
jgi:Activator of Hsp90 ATPase homolog 1-like protein